MNSIQFHIKRHLALAATIATATAATTLMATAGTAAAVSSSDARLCPYGEVNPLTGCQPYTAGRLAAQTQADSVGSPLVHV